MQHLKAHLDLPAAGVLLIRDEQLGVLGTLVRAMPVTGPDGSETCELDLHLRAGVHLDLHLVLHLPIAAAFVTTQDLVLPVNLVRVGPGPAHEGDRLQLLLTHAPQRLDPAARKLPLSELAELLLANL